MNGGTCKQSTASSYECKCPPGKFQTNNYLNSTTLNYIEKIFCVVKKFPFQFDLQEKYTVKKKSRK